MHVTQILFVPLVALTVLACSDKEPGPTLNIGELITSEEFKQSSAVSPDISLDSLNKYIAQFPELQSLTTGTTNLTLFAPSNTAFINLIGIPGTPNSAFRIYPDVLQAILSYHFADRPLMQEEILPGVSITSLFYDPVLASDQLIGISNANGKIMIGWTTSMVQPDNIATNGVVHIVSAVILPPSMNSLLSEGPKFLPITGCILLGKEFTNLAKVIAASDALVTENESTLTYKIRTWLSMPRVNPYLNSSNEYGFTFFAPTNVALTDELTTALLSMPDKGRSVILNHIVSHEYIVDVAPGMNMIKLVNNMTLIPLRSQEKPITVLTGQPASSQNPFGVTLSNTPDDPGSFKPITGKNWMFNNGVVQAFGGILQ